MCDIISHRILMSEVKPNFKYINVREKLTLTREQGKSPGDNMNERNERWVLRQGGVLLDYDQYRNDLAERCNLEIEVTPLE